MSVPHTQKAADPHWGDGSQVDDSGGNTESGVGEIKFLNLAQCICRESEDDECEDVARP